VTVGVGFLCDNGVVLCADTQITWPQNHKYYESKIYPHRTAHWTMVNTFSGDPSLAKSFNAKFDDAMSLINKPVTLALIADVIETTLSFFDSVLTGDPGQLSMLCAVVVPDKEIALLKTTGTVVNRVVNYDYVGVGDSSVLRYLAQMVAHVHLVGLHSVFQATLLGTYLVLKAKTFVDGCGGDTDIFIVRPNGGIEPRNNESYNLEQHCLMMEQKVKAVLGCYFDNRVDNDSFVKVLSNLDDALKREHEYIRTRMP
jgi:hypothetical protein